jgi:hypothetical protein
MLKRVHWVLLCLLKLVLTSILFFKREGQLLQLECSHQQV